ncbi:putative membrane protein [Peribacillus deserti]|uniref:Membrane protein n=1 Tax=Peribacillus deserti TaxID=673318 RepID=A0ABS2QI94_9BACI|nr:DUF2254 domain-containing protein [Peribacillus deserti]MBM7692745.1 putative membrane protein [Peribacillus deserti]
MLLKEAENKIKTNFWVLPALYGVGALVLAVLSVAVEHTLSQHENIKNLIPSIFFTDKELAQTVLSAISTSLLTMTTITFSSVLVVLTTFLSQFSPRTLQNFINDSKTQLVLGTFIGGYIYALVLLSQVKGSELDNSFIVPSFAILVAFICLGMFVFLIHHVTDWIKVGNLVSNITSETLASVEKHYKGQEMTGDSEENDLDLNSLKSYGIESRKQGYIEYADIVGMVSFAEDHELIIKFEKVPGEYVDIDTPILTVWNSPEKLDERKLLDFLLISPTQEVIEDIEFGIQKLVEIALRGIAPGKNDPETAINCIENLSQILTKVGKNYSPSPYYYDSDKNIRVILEKPSFADLLYESFYQIRHYGKADVSVMTSIINALTLIAETNREEIKQYVWDFSLYLVEGIKQQDWLGLDKNYLNRHLLKLAKACNEVHEEKLITI